MSSNNKLGYLFLGFLGILGLFGVYVMADSDIPYGVRDVSYIRSSRANVTGYAPDSMEAEAGNVTELTITTIATTKVWQGYYGNVTGTLTLEDSSGFVFYNWSSSEPKGEIYASVNDTVSWVNITCFNWTGDVLTLEDAEDFYGIGDDASDGINETFTQTGLDADLYVGSRNITAVTAAAGYSCHSTNVYTSGSQSVTGDWENVLLHDGQGALVFATIIENNDFNNITDKLGFDNRLHDFQLLVAENGQNGFEDTTTTYYFWAEIQ